MQSEIAAQNADTMSKAVRTPKICFYGGMANNCYMTAKRFSEIGANVLFIRDWLDVYAISQPIWEDKRLSLSFDELQKSSTMTIEEWLAFEREHEWRPPDWYVDPRRVQEQGTPILPEITLDSGIRQYLHNLAPADHSLQILHLMQQCDLLFVCNVHAILLALVSGKPFVICPAGGEFLIASGQITNTGSVGQILDWQRQLLLHAFRESEAVATTTPFLLHAALTGGYVNLLRKFWNVPFRHSSLPYLAAEPIPAEAKREILNGALGDLGLEPVTTRFAAFIPSRIDYRWKGQDRILDALDAIDCASDFTIIVTGWGADYENFIHRTSLNKRILSLGRAISKPLMYDFYRGSDLVLDQFTLGHYGTSTREAASVGTPVVGWLNKRVPSMSSATSSVPLLDARDSESIASVLRGISDSSIDLAMHGMECTAWARTYAAPARVLAETTGFMKK